jgi:microcystin-dependent protein
MSDPFLAEIRMFGGSFAPSQWAFCNGALLSVSQNTALFNIVRTSFGGNGTTTFALPNLQDRVPVGAGSGKDLSPYVVGQQVGQTMVTLTAAQMPAHSHQVSANPNVADLKTPTANTSFARSSPGSAFAPDTGNKFDAMDASAFSGFTGGGLAHNNIQPYLAVVFIIALQGRTPLRP